MFDEQLAMYNDEFDEASFAAVSGWVCRSCTDTSVTEFRADVDAAIGRLRVVLSSLDDAVACVGENVPTERGFVVSVVLYRRRHVTPLSSRESVGGSDSGW